MQWGRRSGASWTGLGRTVGLALCLALVGSCNELARTDRAASFLVIVELSGGTEGLTVFRSDVLTGGTVFEDLGQLTARLALKDPGPSTSPAAPSSANWITIDRYRVVYVRTDGANAPGVDVPVPFEGAMTFTTTGAAASAEFTLVRASAKLQAPLVALQNGGGLIYTVAEVTFFGHDQTGTEIIANGRITVNFADWADD